jgi:hypothetical protein
MKKRREFLGAMGMAAAGACLPREWAWALEQEKAELILHGGTIWTVNAREPRAEAIAVARGRILAVGSDADILALASPATKKIDLGKKTVDCGDFGGIAGTRGEDGGGRLGNGIQIRRHEDFGRAAADDWGFGCSGPGSSRVHPASRRAYDLLQPAGVSKGGD